MSDWIEIRRIAEAEGDPVAELWDRMCREIPDGGPLTERGKRNIAGWLAMSAWHERAFCLVAVDGSTIIGFVNGRTDVGDGLLPGMAGEIESLSTSYRRRAETKERTRRSPVLAGRRSSAGSEERATEQRTEEANTFGRPERERPENTE